MQKPTLIYSPGMNLRDFMEANNTYGQPEDVQEHARKEYKRLYMAAYKRRQRAASREFTIILAPHEWKAVKNKAAKSGKTITSLLKTSALNSIYNKAVIREISLQDREVKQVLMTAKNCLEYITHTNPLDTASRDLVETMLTQINQTLTKF